MADQAPPIPSRSRPRQHPAVVVIVWVFGGGAGLGWLSVALMALGPLLFSAMLFDAPGSEDNPYLWVVVGSLLALPILSLISAVATPATVLVSQLLHRRGSTRAGWVALAAAVLVACLPLLALAGIAAGFTLANTLCDGSFSC